MRTIGILLLFTLLAGADPAVIDAAPFLDPSRADAGLQRAIDEAAALPGGAIARLPPGEIRLRTGLVLKSNVQLTGAGMDRTVLLPARQLVRLEVTAESPDPAGLVHLASIPDELQVGSAVTSFRSYPAAWYGEPRPAWVTGIDREAKAVRLEAPYGLSAMKPGAGYLLFGDALAPAASARKGDTEIVVHHAGLLQPGDELALGEPPNESLLAHAWVREVRGNTVVLTEPLRQDFAAWPDAKTIGNKKVNALIWVVHPLIHGANLADAAVRDLTVLDRPLPNAATAQTRYTLAGIHLYNARRVVLERVAVRDWFTDGISLQTGDACQVLDSEATGCAGNGLHPGTGLTNSRFERCLASRNGAGLYFCWHNAGHVLSQNRFIDNRGGGITGLGNPGDRQNLIEGNTIARNGGAGIEINGGPDSGNIIRGNTIEDNSQAGPGKHPGIAIYASAESAGGYLIEQNTIRDTQTEKTQQIGIEERHGQPGDKPRLADRNTIRGNTFSGAVTDIVLAGEQSVAADNGDAKVERRQ